MLPDIQPGNTKILYFFNCLLDGMHTKIIPICDFRRCGLNVRLDARTFKPCSQVTDRDYFILRGLTVAGVGFFWVRLFLALREK